MSQSCVLTIGNFDGVHAGHQHLIEQAKGIAVQEGLPLYVLTFWPHPRTVVRPQSGHHSLMTPDEREEALLQNGVQKVHTLTFDKELSYVTAEAFIQNILKDQFKAQHIVVGENFHFGHKAAGNIETLKQESAFTTHAVKLLSDEKGRFSSTRLRQELTL